MIAERKEGEPSVEEQKEAAPEVVETTEVFADRIRSQGKEAVATLKNEGGALIAETFGEDVPDEVVDGMKELDAEAEQAETGLGSELAPGFGAKEILRKHIDLSPEERARQKKEFEGHNQDRVDALFQVKQERGAYATLGPSEAESQVGIFISGRAEDDVGTAVENTIQFLKEHTANSREQWSAEPLAATRLKALSSIKRERIPALAKKAKEMYPEALHDIYDTQLAILDTYLDSRGDVVPDEEMEMFDRLAIPALGIERDIGAPEMKERVEPKTIDFLVEKYGLDRALLEERASKLSYETGPEEIYRGQGLEKIGGHYSNGKIVVAEQMRHDEGTVIHETLHGLSDTNGETHFVDRKDSAPWMGPVLTEGHIETITMEAVTDQEADIELHDKVYKMNRLVVEQAQAQWKGDQPLTVEGMTQVLFSEEKSLEAYLRASGGTDEQIDELFSFLEPATLGIAMADPSMHHLIPEEKREGWVWETANTEQS